MAKGQDSLWDDRLLLDEEPDSPPRPWWKCPECRCWLGDRTEYVASCPECGRAYVCVLDEEVKASQEAISKRKKN
jgi:hypothetical protein